MFQTGAAVRDAFFGNMPEARRAAKAALELSKSRDVEYGASFALAIAGDAAAAQNLSVDLERQFPEDTCVRFTYLPINRALLALNNHDAASAIEQLQPAAPYELGVPCSWFGFFGNLYAPYVRGQAYLAAHRYAEAAGEFRKILDHPGIVFTDPVHVAAKLQLARALLGAGDTARAKTAYENFLTLWKDADPDIDTFKQAKTEFANLR